MSVTDYQKVYAEHWRHRVETGGTLNTDQVMRELSDYWIFLGMVSEVYDDVTGGRISKPDTAPVHVIGAVNERIRDAAREAVTDLIASIEGIPERSFATVGDMLELVRELADLQVGVR